MYGSRADYPYLLWLQNRLQGQTNVNNRSPAVDQALRFRNRISGDLCLDEALQLCDGGGCGKVIEAETAGRRERRTQDMQRETQRVFSSSSPGCLGRVRRRFNHRRHSLLDACLFDLV